MELPRFETKRLLLKEITMEDAPSYERNFVDYEIIRHLAAAVPWPYPKDGIVDFINRILTVQGKDRWVWGIFLKSNPSEIVGVVDLWREGKPEHRGFWLAKKLWGQGLMTEAVEPIMDHAFLNLGFETLVFSNALGNIASRKVKEKTGARFIDIRPAKFVDPNYTQHEVWELKKADWFSFKQLRELKLVRPNKELANSYLEFISEMRALGEKILDANIPSNGETIDSFIARLLKAEHSPIEGLVAESIYWAIRNNEVVGRIALRHSLNKNLEEFGGHIGYEVRPSARRKGIATQMLRLILETPKAQEIGRLLLTCAPDNVASNKTILSNSGVLAGSKFVERVNRQTNYYWIEN